jgi:hypothetical protein
MPIIPPRCSLGPVQNAFGRMGDHIDMRDAEHFRQSYEAGEPPWDIAKPDFNLIQIVARTPISPCKTVEFGCGTGDNAILAGAAGIRCSSV